MPSKYSYFIVERAPGNSFTTYRSPAIGEQRVPIGVRRIGPFGSIPAAADWLSVHAFKLATYTIEEHVDVRA